MAKKDRLDFGRDSWDSNLDFDFDDDFDIPKPSNKKSTPISQLTDGIKSSLKTKFTDSSHIRGMIRKSLPEGFGQAWDSIDQIVTDTSQLYDEATKELKPLMGSVSRKFDQLVPESAKRTKDFAKGLRDRFDDGEIDNNSSYYSENAEDQGVARMLSELEGDRETNEENRHQQKLARDLIESRVEDKRFLANQKMLGIIANDIHAIRRYQTSFDIMYKKKSLELQYRTYAATATMLKNTIEFQKHSMKFHDALLHNTSLPEYAKTSNTQRWKQVSKEQIFGRLNDGLFGAKSRVGLAGQRLMKMGREKISGGKDALEMLNDALDMALDGREMDQQMAEMEGRESSGWRTAGTFGGSIIGDMISDKISEFVKKRAEKNPKLMKRSFQAGRFATNPGALIDMMRNSDWYKKLGADGSESGDLMQNILGFGFDLLAGEKPDMTIKSTSIGKEGENKLHTQMKVNRSLTEVIPGYLARILREVTALRTGDDKTPLLMYDTKSENFKTQATLARDIVSGLKRSVTEAAPDMKTYAENAQSAYKTFVGDEKIDTVDSKEIQRFINELSRSTEDFDFTGDRLKKTKEFNSLNPRVKKIVERILEKRFTGDGLDVAKNQFQFASSAVKVKGSIGNLMGPIQEAIRDGYGDLLEQQGIIKRDKNGDWQVDEKQYYKFFDDSVEVASDVNLKHNISKSKLDPTKSVNAFKNTPIYDWDYKPGTKYAGPKGYGKQQYTGPMAQDVRSRFGDDAAPGGKTIDLVNLNGHTMAAVKKLAEMVESMGAGEGLKHLKNIDETTLKILESISSGDQGSSSIPGIDLTGAASKGKQFVMNGSTSVGAALGSLLTSLVDTAMAGGKAAGKGAVKAGQGAASAATDFWSNNKEGIKDARDSVLRATANAVSKSINFGSDVIFNQLPKLSAAGGRVLNSVMDGVKNIFQTVDDLYMEGMDSPVIVGSLLAAGYYYDSATSKVLKTMDDVAKAKGDIVDSMGRVKLSVVDRARGIRTKTGTMLKTFGQTALGVAKAGGMYLASGAMNLYNKAKDSLQNTDFDKMLGTARDKAISVKDKVADKLNNFRFGIGGTDPRVVPVLIQIRDLLAIGKSGKRVKEILSRSLEESKESTNKSTSTKASDDIDENPDKVNTSLLTQLRDLAASDKPKEVLDGIYSRAKNAKTFMNAPLFGSSIKTWFDKLKSGSAGQSAVSQMGPELMGPAPEMTGPMPQAGVANYSNSGGLGGIIGGLGGLFGAGKQAVGSLADAFTDRFPGTGDRVRNSRVGKIGSRIGNSKVGGLAKRVGNSRLGKWGTRGLGVAGSVLGIAANVFGSMFGNSNQDPSQQNQQADESIIADQGTNTYSARDHAMRLMQLGASKAGGAYKRVRGMFGDNDGDGQRDGGSADRMKDAQANQMANEERKKASIESSQRGAQEKASRNSPADNAIEKMIAMATAGLSSIAGMASSLIGGAAELLTGGLGAGKLLGKAGKGVLKGAWAGAKMLGRGALAAGKGILGVGRTLGAIGTGIKGVAAMVPGASTVARVGVGAIRALQVVGLATGGSAGMISGAAALIGSALTSPVVIGGLAVAGAVYGGYKLYKYLTRNSIDDWERIRIMQYGLDGADATKQYNNKVIALEKYLLDGKLAFNGGIPTINSRAAKPEEIAELFDISPEDTDTAKKFSVWYTERFSPVFLKHVATLYRVNNKSSLEKIDSLTDAEKLEYLSGIEIPMSVWEKTTSPFKGLDILSSNPQPVMKIINAKIQTLGKKIQDEAGKKAKAGGNSPNPQEAKMANETIKSAIPEQAKSQTNNSTQEPNRTPNRRSIPANSHLGRAIANGDVEEPAAYGKPSSEQKGNSVTMGASSLKLAAGPLASGESGMQFVKLGNGVDIEGLHPRMKQQLLAMAQEYGEATGKQLNITSAYRSFKDQERLYAKYGPGRAARPGGSLHEYGLAADMSSQDLNELEKLGLLRKYGFTRPIYGETWHIEPAGIQTAIDQAKRDPKFADSAILASLGRGGGGAGSTPRTPVGGRNPALAKALYEQSGGTVVKLTDQEGLPPSPASGLSSPMVQGQSMMTTKAVQQGAMGSFGASGSSAPGGTGSPAMLGAAGGNIEFSGNNDASASIGDDKHSDIKKQIAKYATEVGANPNEMMMLAAMESGFNPKAKAGTSSAEGPMQFVNATWNEQLSKHGAKYGLSPDTPKSDIRANVILAHEYMKSNGAKGDFTDKYMTHMFGAGGSSRLNKASPSDLAYRILPKAANSNREIFFDGSRPRTVEEVKQALAGRISKKAKDFGIVLNEPGVATANAEASSATQSPVPYNPIKPAVYNPKTVAGYDLPDYDVPVMTRGDAEASAVKPVRPVGMPSAAPGMMTGSNSGATSRDTSLQMTAQIFDRFTKVADDQIKHLSSIDTSISDKVVPLLERIAENTQSLTTMGAAAGNGEGTKPNSSVRNFASSNDARKADSSSFDNRRVL